jgi:glutamate--cysteine ligase
MCDPTMPITRSDLVQVFAKSSDSTERIGLEVEVAAVDPVTGESCPYDGERGVRALLETIERQVGGHGIRQGDDLVAVVRDDASQVTLEPGGAIEYGSAPADDVVGLMAKTTADLRLLADCAATLGIALVPGANYPFTDMSSVKWAPKRHSEIVRGYLAGIGTGGEWGPEVMALTLSTQVTLDYTGAADLHRKLCTQVAASPVATALFVNSPLKAGRWTGLLSQRMRYWTRHDPRRTGVLAPALDERFTVSNFIDWALSLRMIYRQDRNGDYVPAPGRSFGSLLDDGFDDGSMPTWQDWLQHLSQIWTDVRLRGTLELRAVDGPPYRLLETVPAFWVGLTYDAASCEDAWELLRGYDATDYRNLMDEVASRGMRARLRGAPVREIATELLRLARRGMTARVDKGLEDPAVLRCLEPLDEVAASGVTFAERCLRDWRADLRQSPQRYVRAYRIPVE